MKINLNNITVVDAMFNYCESGIVMCCEDGKVQYASTEHQNKKISNEVVGALIYMRGEN